MTGDTVKKTLVGAAAGLALAIGGTAALANGPVCSKSRLTGLSADHPRYMDGGMGDNWVGMGHGQAPPDKPTSKGVEGDAACESKKLSDLEQVCLKEWRKSYCP